MGPGCWGDLTSCCLASTTTSPFQDVEVWLTFVLATLTSDLGEAWGWEHCPRGTWGKEVDCLLFPRARESPAFGSVSKRHCPLE